MDHTPSIVFRHLPPHFVRTGYAPEGALPVIAQLSTDAVSALRKGSVFQRQTDRDKQGTQRDTDRQTDRQTHRDKQDTEIDRNRQTDRDKQDTERETDRQRQKETNRQRQTGYTERDRDRDRQTEGG